MNKLKGLALLGLAIGTGVLIGLGVTEASTHSLKEMVKTYKEDLKKSEAENIQLRLVLERQGGEAE